MKLSYCLSFVLLVLVVVNVVIVSVDAYSDIRQSIYDTSPNPSLKQIQKPQYITEKVREDNPNSTKGIFSSNVIMVWEKDDGEKGYHDIDMESFNKLTQAAKSLPPIEFEYLMLEAQKLSTDEFLAILNTSNFKEQYVHRLAMNSDRDSSTE